jgi:mannose-6-phosphate isomerase-like protein (cupin superfamily)
MFCHDHYLIVDEGNNMEPINLEVAASSCRDMWSPIIVADVNSTAIKVARVQGEFVWHDHEFEDEAFLVLQGSLTIRYEDHEVTLNAGDLHVVPRGVSHCPVAEEECLIALIEQDSTAHTGKLKTTRTRSNAQQRNAAKKVIGN